jgi:hypothetical protein
VTLPLSYSRLLLPTAAPIRKIRSQRKTSNHRQRHRAGRPHCRIIQRPPCRNSQHNEQSHGEKETVHARSLLIVTNPKPQQWCTGEDSNLRSSQGAADLQSAAINHSATCAKLCRTLRVQSLRHTNKNSQAHSNALHSPLGKFPATVVPRLPCAWAATLSSPTGEIWSWRRDLNP